jgi:hypothetical protein
MRTEFAIFAGSRILSRKDDPSLCAALAAQSVQVIRRMKGSSEKALLIERIGYIDSRSDNDYVI